MKNRLKPLAFVSLAIISLSVREQAQSTSGTFTTVKGTEGCSMVTADPGGNIYFGSDRGVEKIAAGTGRITKLTDLTGVAIAVDSTGNLYVATGGWGPPELKNRVLKIAPVSRA